MYGHHNMNYMVKFVFWLKICEYFNEKAKSAMQF